MPLLPGAEPYHHDGGAVGVLVLHGFTGQPRSVTPWARELADAGYTVSVPRLPGHGTRWEDLAVTRFADWYSEADRAFTALREICERVAVAGLSMGGTLSLRLAERRPEEVAALLLVNPSVHTERFDRHLLPVARRLLKKFPGIVNDIKRPGQDEGGYDSMPLNAFHSLQQAWGEVKADIGAIVAPMLVMHSREDHVVEPSNSAWILEHVSSAVREEVWLEDSYHVATLDNDFPVIVARSLDFLRTHVQTASAAG